MILYVKFHFICKISLLYVKFSYVSLSENFQIKIFYKRKISKKLVLKLKFNAKNDRHGLNTVRVLFTTLKFINIQYKEVWTLWKKTLHTTTRMYEWNEYILVRGAKVFLCEDVCVFYCLTTPQPKSLPLLQIKFTSFSL